MDWAFSIVMAVAVYWWLNSWRRFGVVVVAVGAVAMAALALLVGGVFLLSLRAFGMVVAVVLCVVVWEAARAIGARLRR